MLSGITRAYPSDQSFYLPFIGIFVCVHAVAASVSGDLVDYVSAPFQMTAELLAAWRCMCMARTCRPSARPGWIYLAAACALTALNTAACIWVYRIQELSYDFANFSDFLYIFNYIALTWAVLWSEDQEAGEVFFWLDMVKAAIALLLCYVLLFNTLPFASLTYSPIPATTLILAFGIMNAALVIMTLIRLIGRRIPLQQRAFDSRLTLFIVSFLSVLYVYNHAFGSRPGPQDVLIDLPFLALWALLGRPPADRRETGSNSKVALIVDSLGPALVTTIVVSLGVMVAAQRPWLGLGAIAVALPLSALRSGLAQSYYIRMQHEVQKAYSKLEKIATEDGLTGIANRRNFDVALKLNFDLALRNRTDLALLMIDVDFFKKLNDAHGHVAGDKCLIAIACALNAAKNRETDTVARYGGEEFAVILPGCDLTNARIIAQNMSAAIRALKIPNQTPIGDHVTVSIGLCIANAATMNDEKDLISCADHALYQAKQGGRNQVFCGTAPMTD